MSLKQRQRAAARAELNVLPSQWHVRQAVINLFRRNKIPAGYYPFIDAFIISWGQALKHARPGEDPRLRVFVGARSTHKLVDPECDCKSRTKRSAAGWLCEKCLRYHKRIRADLVRRGWFKRTHHNPKGGCIKGRKRGGHPVGDADGWWLDGELAEEVMHEIAAKRGSSPGTFGASAQLGEEFDNGRPDFGAAFESNVTQGPHVSHQQRVVDVESGVLGDVLEELSVGHEHRQALAAVQQSSVERNIKRLLLSNYLRPDGRRRLVSFARHKKASELKAGQPSLGLHGPSCACESCMPAATKWLDGHDPPAESPRS